MDGRDAPPEGILIHNIIMDQRECVGQLECKGRRHNIRGTSMFHCIGSKQDNSGTETFASCREEMRTGFVQFTDLVDKIPVDHKIDVPCNGFQVRGEF